MFEAMAKLEPNFEVEQLMNEIIESRNLILAKLLNIKPIHDMCEAIFQLGI